MYLYCIYICYIHIWVLRCALECMHEHTLPSLLSPSSINVRQCSTSPGASSPTTNTSRALRMICSTYTQPFRLRFIDFSWSPFSSSPPSPTRQPSQKADSSSPRLPILPPDPTPTKTRQTAPAQDSPCLTPDPRPTSLFQLDTYWWG